LIFKIISKRYSFDIQTPLAVTNRNNDGSH
jgi:hypothetical protein